MDPDERKAAIRARIEEQIEAVARAICEHRSPIAALLVLEALTSRLVSEELQDSPGVNVVPWYIGSAGFEGPRGRGNADQPLAGRQQART